MQAAEFQYKMSSKVRSGSPFLFVINYEMDDFRLYSFERAAEEGIFFNIKGVTNTSEKSLERPARVTLQANPIDFETYNTAYQQVRKHIFHGNTFLLNLTFPTPLECNLKLEEIFHFSQAPYKLLFKDQFVVFSPENFIRIKGNTIFSYPMKGTIDASLKGAEKMLLNNEKEIREHNTIVDLIRNDLSLVAKNVRVLRFRFIDRIRTHKGELLQVSSEISGELSENWKDELGTLLISLLPAGSICGAPKKKTLEVIKEAEGTDRGFFTGIFGIFDGRELDSAVMIRYIESTENGLQFRSGGGITGRSDPREEYNEMMDKVYVPII